MLSRTSLILPLIVCTEMLRAADPASAFAPWSSVKNYDLEKLARGKVVAECNGSMNFARGISAQAVFIVQAAPDAALRSLLASDPTKRPEQETWQRPTFHTAQDAGFARLKLDLKLPPMRRLIESMRERKGLHLTRDEIALLPTGDRLDDVQHFWAELIRQHWLRWTEKGELRSTDEFDVRSEIASLLKEEPQIARHFAELLTPFTQSGPPPIPAQHYWDLSNVNHSAAVCLGVIYTRAAQDRLQVLDVSYYSSSGYLASITLYEFLPITLDGSTRTLVWEGCMVSAPALAGGFGLKKAIGSRLMLGDFEKSIHFFQQDVIPSR